MYYVYTLANIFLPIAIVHFSNQLFKKQYYKLTCRYIKVKNWYVLLTNRYLFIANKYLLLTN